MHLEIQLRFTRICWKGILLSLLKIRLFLHSVAMLENKKILCSSVYFFMLTFFIIFIYTRIDFYLLLLLVEVEEKHLYTLNLVCTPSQANLSFPVVLLLCTGYVFEGFHHESEVGFLFLFLTDFWMDNEVQFHNIYILRVEK